MARPGSRSALNAIMPDSISPTQRSTETRTKPAPAASLAAIRIPVGAPKTHPGGTAGRPAPSLAPTPPLPNNDDEPIPHERRFPAAVTGKSVIEAEPPGIPAREPPAAPAAVIDLWEHLAAHRLRPKLSDLDAVTVARQWPNSLLLRVTEDTRRPALEVAHMFVPTAGGPTIPIPIDAMTVDWIVALGQEVVLTRAPIHETDAVPTTQGAIQCGVIALPFGTEACVDHVLCHLYRVDETVIEGEAVTENSLPPRDRTGIKRLFGR